MWQIISICIATKIHPITIIYAITFDMLWLTRYHNHKKITRPSLKAIYLIVLGHSLRFRHCVLLFNDGLTDCDPRHVHIQIHKMHPAHSLLRPQCKTVHAIVIWPQLITQQQQHHVQYTLQSEKQWGNQNLELTEITSSAGRHRFILRFKGKSGLQRRRIWTWSWLGNRGKLGTPVL